MSEKLITVSDGEDFFKIPLDDLAEASADGFYVPAFEKSTIVSNGEEMFEIPISDLAEAMEEGYRDTLVGERELLVEARRLLGTESSGSNHGRHDCSSSTAASETLSATTETISTETPAPTTAVDHEAAQEELDTDDLPEADEPEGEGISKFLLPASHVGAKNAWQVMLINTALHGVVVLLLTLIILPMPEVEVFMEITSAVEPKDPVEMDFEAVELEQSLEMETEPVETENMNQLDIPTEEVVNIDISDVEVSVPESLIDPSATAGPPTTNTKSEMGGRSQAGRAQLVAKRGGNAASEAAVTRGLEWMSRHQYPDGGWSFDHTRGECQGQCKDPGSLTAECRNAATGMALLTMLGAGQTPFEGDFSPEVKRGVEFLLANSKLVPAGLDMRGLHATHTGMYTHAIAATALCEVLAMVQHEYNSALSSKNKDQIKFNPQRRKIMALLKPAAAAGIQFIVNAQDQKSGGWGYDPGAKTTMDTSILGWQIMALKSAHHVHVPVPAATVQASNRFLTSVATPDGWFGYREPQKKASTTAIGIIARMLSGMPRNHPQVEMGVAHLSAAGPSKNDMYYNYYATQVMMQYGGQEWKKWNSVMRDQLVNSQIKKGHATGSWNLADNHGKKAGRLYMTCLATMTLEVYYRHLPLYGEPGDLGKDGESKTLDLMVEKKDQK